MNIAVIFAAGKGLRMKSNDGVLPKQFTKVNGKPIIVYTIEKFQYCNCIDSIIVVTLSDYIKYIEELKEEYKLHKIVEIVVGGETSQESIYNGLTKAKEISKYPNDIVIIHDGVRPLINNEIIKKSINCARTNGNAITVSKASETVLFSNGLNNNCVQTLDRDKCFIGRAPQTFVIDEIFNAAKTARLKGLNNFVDCASMLEYFGNKLYLVEGPDQNIKITTTIDLEVFKQLVVK